MSATFQKLRAKLAELFQLDAAAELDFGIYRILNARRIEVERFLDGLQTEVEAIIKALLADKSSTAHGEAGKLKAQLESAGVDPATSPKYLKLQEEAARAGGSTFELENEIFSHLATFFSRYYKDGDFLSLRRYKRDTYAIPYEGEEVKLHWANADQFYIKSAENFRDYTFRLGPAPKDGTPDTRPSVTFKLIEADTERDNNKAVAGKERRFIHTGVVSHTPESLALGFEYRALTESDAAPADHRAPGRAGILPADSGILPESPDARQTPPSQTTPTDAPADGKKPKPKDQATLNREAVQKILAECARGPFAEIAALRPTEKNKQRSLLEKHLADYTARNTFDYFIHKDLGGFLRRELDFFIKNEVLHLDDLEAAPEADWRQQQARLRAIRAIAHRVIRFLAQVEDFQKKLWLKKKFVTRCDYLITLDRLPAALLPEVAASAAQREEWVRLLAIDEIVGDLGRTGYSVPLTVEFLKENLFLVLDTRHFDEEFRRNVMAGIEDEGAALSGTVVNGENSQSIQLIASKRGGLAKCVYLDPPYNTGGDGFLYKDAFQHASWLAMMDARLRAVSRICANNGVVFVSIDDIEHPRLRILLESTFSEANRLGTVIWKGATDNNPTRIATEHEYVVCYAKDAASVAPVWENKTDATKALMLETYEQISRSVTDVQVIQRQFRDWIREHKESLSPLTHYDRVDEDGPYTGSRKVHNPGKEGYRYDVIHPRTGKACKQPARGYRYPENRMKELLKAEKILFGDDHTQIVQIKEYLKEYSGSMKSWFELDSRTAANALEALFGSREVFKNPKPVGLVEHLLSFITSGNDVVADPFAGSGTTGHAVLNLNREDNGTRKYVLVEMGEHFDTVLVPRLKKVIYAKDWKEGKPQGRNTGVSHACKVLRLESYEDTLNNLRLPARRPEAQELALQAASPAVRDEYTLGYMLELETQGSPSLLNVSAFTDPFSYTLQTATGTAGETRPVNVDLVETFNWLLGLTVRHTDFIREVCVVDGTNPQGERVLVLWRNTAKVDAEALNEWFTKQGYSTRDLEYALIYVNGDHHLENLRREDQTWKVRMIDEEFPRLMWEGCE